MTDEICKKDIRALLKTFGVMADEAIVGHIAKNPAIIQVIITTFLGSIPDNNAKSSLSE